MPSSNAIDQMKILLSKKARAIELRKQQIEAEQKSHDELAAELAALEPKTPEPQPIEST